MKSLKNLPPFVKGDRGGFRRAKRLLHGIESSEMVTRQTLHIAYGDEPRPYERKAAAVNNFLDQYIPIL